MRSFSTVTLFAAAAFVGSQIKAVVAGSGQIVQIVDSKDFCFFLPPAGSSDMNISDNEGDAVAYCMGSTPKATGANSFPSGFILSAHFVSTSDYVQVTGQIDPSKAGLNPSDDGGQYDIMAPQGATCAGYQYFVNLVEPSGNDYCIRCCNTETNCNRGISQDGCARVIPGDYSGPGVSSSGSSSGSSSSSSSSASTHTTTSSSSSPTSDSGDSSSSSSSGSTDTTGSSGSSDTGSGSADSGSSTAASSSVGWTEGDSSVSSSLPATSSVAPSTSIAFVSAASSSAAAMPSTNLPTEGVSAQSVNAATAATPITVTALALGGIAALVQLI